LAIKIFHLCYFDATEQTFYP